MPDLTATWMPLRRFVEATGATPRCVDRWASAGVFGDHDRQPGSGRTRSFSATADVPTARALVALGRLLGQVSLPTAVAVGAAMRSGPGRWLVVGAEGAHRSDGLHFGPASVVVDLEAVELGCPSKPLTRASAPPPTKAPSTEAVA